MIHERRTFDVARVESVETATASRTIVVFMGPSSGELLLVPDSARTQGFGFRGA